MTIDRAEISLGRLAAALIFVVATVFLHAGSAPTLKTGDRAPAVEGQDQDGKVWRLADCAGQQAVILYFYPKDNTPGCTKQACGLRDRMADLKKEGVVVVGVSFDSPESHRKFIADHQLNFTLLSDPAGQIAGAFGAKMEGRSLARRVSFLIGKDGRIKHITDAPSAEVHLAEMKAAVASLK